ncbi:hypothetical protein Stsp01_33700 [Streptomyces sp. NBRC 13847]|nr:hypothetical protein Stsp01_33700 [Streptomyces sp. NBRC 13847]
MEDRGFPGMGTRLDPCTERNTDMDWVNSLVSTIGPIISSLVTHFLG